VTAVEPRRLGAGILELGGGRRTMEDTIDHAVGFVVTVKPGDRVREGEPIASIFARDDAGIAAGTAALREAIALGESGHLTPLITHRITARGVELLAGPTGTD
jgi:thymidine phosphorylase